MRDLTYRNLIAVIHKIESKGYDFEEFKRLARGVFAGLQNHPQGLSIEKRVRQILTKEEWEKEYRK